MKKEKKCLTVFDKISTDVYHLITPKSGAVAKLALQHTTLTTNQLYQLTYLKSKIVCQK